jgi:regulatory protein
MFKNRAPLEPLSSASLRGRAIAALSRREHSRKELYAKLLPLAADHDQLETTLNALESEGLLSDQRCAESVGRVRGSKYGMARVRHELQQKGIEGPALESVVDDLRASELERLQQVWAKKFGRAPETADERQKQHRFLAQRGFSAEAIGQLFRGLRDKL